MTELERVEEIRESFGVAPGFMCASKEIVGLELCDIARKALEERDVRCIDMLVDDLNAENARLERRLKAATELTTFLSQEDCEYRTPLGNRWVSCGNCIPCRARLWLEDKQDG